LKWAKLAVIGVALATLFYTSALARPTDEHIQRQVEHPCGQAGLDFEGLTGFFHYKWKADFRDLNDSAVQVWLRHHGLEHTQITVVRLFKSSVQPTVAVLHGRRFINYLNGQTLVDMLCIVKVNGSHVMQYEMTRIEEILRSGGEDT
jgi:hypothetical protein